MNTRTAPKRAASPQRPKKPVKQVGWIGSDPSSLTQRLVLDLRPAEIKACEFLAKKEGVTPEGWATTILRRVITQSLHARGR